MANGLFNRYATPGRAVDQAQYDEGLRQHMLSVYNYMSIGLGLTGVVAFVTAMLAMSNPAVAQVLYGSPRRQSSACRTAVPSISTSKPCIGSR